MTATRPKEWLSEYDARRVGELTRKFQTQWKSSVDPQAYTLHDPGHFGRVEQNILGLIPSRRWRLLNDEERFLLSCAAWTHDIAMKQFGVPVCVLGRGSEGPGRPSWAVAAGGA